MTLRIAIVGFGKIAADQHVPAIARTAGAELVAVASPHGGAPAGVAHAPSFDALLKDGPAFDAVALCTPPQVRAGVAATAIAAGKHVLLEKPPSAALSEAVPLVAAAERTGTTLFAAWHSRFAPAVAPAKAALAGRRVAAVRIEWREDVRVWHPGQAWVWEPGGLGVFDPGINALSIATEILPRPVALKAAELSFPANRGTPIAARLAMADADGAPVTADFDWSGREPQRWAIEVDLADGGRLVLEEGGARLSIDGVSAVDAADDEYPNLYRRFVELVAAGRSDVDLAPMILAADAFLLGRRVEVEPFVADA